MGVKLGEEAWHLNLEPTDAGTVSLCVRCNDARSGPQTAHL